MPRGYQQNRRIKIPLIDKAMSFDSLGKLLNGKTKSQVLRMMDMLDSGGGKQSQTLFSIL